MLLPSEAFAQEKDTGGHEFDSLYDARYDNRIVRVRAIFALTGFRENRRGYAKQQQRNTTGDFHFKASHVRRTCEFTKKFLAISFEECALLRMRKIRDDGNDARAAIA